MDKHTTGPWYWEKLESGRIRLYTPKNGSCTVMDFTRRGMQGGQPRFSNRNGQPLGGIMIDAVDLDLDTHPDACLLAAAPDIYEALKALLEACITADAEGELPGQITGEILDAAGRALDKAEVPDVETAL